MSVAVVGKEEEGGRRHSGVFVRVDYGSERALFSVDCGGKGRVGMREEDGMKEWERMGSRSCGCGTGRGSD